MDKTRYALFATKMRRPENTYSIAKSLKIE
jgi:hypothetical protein